MTEKDYRIRRVQGLKGNDYNTVAVVLPKEMCEKLDIGKGDYMKISLVGNRIEVEKAK